MRWHLPTYHRDDSQYSAGRLPALLAPVSVLLHSSTKSKMALSFESIITSTPFKFLVGHERKLLTVHAALIAHHSKPLGVLVRGPMLEANQGFAVLEDIEEGTFIRFSQYAYTGDYSTPAPGTSGDGATTNDATNGAANGIANGGGMSDESGLMSPTSGEYSATITAADLWGSSYRLKKKKPAVAGKKGFSWDEFDKPPDTPNLLDEGSAEEQPRSDGGRSKKSRVWDEFESKMYVPAPPPFKPRKNRDATEDYTDIFLCHARLYVFAEKYDIAPLKRLALYKLQRTLVDFTLYPERVADVVELIKYSYTNTADMVGTPDDLRVLVIRYTGYVVEDLAQNPQFTALLEEVSQVGRDLMRQMLKRLE